MGDYGIEDGLGFEEVNQSTGRTTVVYGTRISGTNIYGSVGIVSTISGLDIRAGSIATYTGRLYSASIGSVAVYGARVQAGSLVTSAGSIGTALFGTPYAGTNYYVNLTAMADNSGKAPWVVTGSKNASGTTIVGEASVGYNWIAVGI